MITRVVNKAVEPFDVSIQRATSGGDANGYYGNPVRSGWYAHLGPEKARAQAVLLFAELFLHRMGLRRSASCAVSGWLYVDQQYVSAIFALKGKTLGCGCKPLACHGDVYAVWLNGGLPALLNYMRKLRELLSGTALPADVFQFPKRCPKCRLDMTWEAEWGWRCLTHGRTRTRRIRGDRYHGCERGPKVDGVAIVIRSVPDAR